MPTKKTEKATKTTKTTKTRATKGKATPANSTRLSVLEAATKVLSESGSPMTSREMIDAMATKGYWSSPGGKTPHATLYAAILREINTKGDEARFQKTERGKFTVVAANA